MYHYVYYSYEQWGRGYIGVRSSKVPPKEDTKYWGSFLDKTFKPTEKIIIEEFETREEAYGAEVLLHNFYSVQINSHFANRAKATVSGFSMYGRKQSIEQRQKVSKALKGRKRNVPEHVIEMLKTSCKGRKQSLEEINKRVQKLKGRKRTIEQRKKMRDSHLGKSKPHLYKPVTVICNKTGEILKFSSQKEAIEKLNLLQPNFCNMVAGKRKSCGGYSIFNG
jgi:citrate synthase